MSPKKDTRQSAKSTTATGKRFKGFTYEERAAMREHIQGEEAVAMPHARSAGSASGC